MTASPNAPRLLKGAIVVLTPSGAPGRVIVFQYNPDALTRTLTARMLGGEGGPAPALRFSGPPEESIEAQVEIDAADQLEEGDPRAVAMGIQPALAALEALLYPDSAQVIANDKLLAAGSKEIIPPEAPLTLFVWGPARVVPVQVSRLTIAEEAFDPALNPIRAKVTLSLNVLSYRELDLASTGGAVFLAYQIAKEMLATTASGSLPLKLNGGLGG